MKRLQTQHVQSSGKPFLKAIREIADLFKGTDKPISVEVNPHHDDYKAMVAEAEKLAAGGHPKELNLYQSQKALAHASLVTRTGGTVVLTAACPESSGSRAYESWMEGVHSYEEVFARFRREPFRVGPHKAFLIARDAARVRVFLVSDMASELVRRLLLTPAANIDEALAFALADLSADGRVGIMPWASSTIPYIQQVGPP